MRKSFDGLCGLISGSLRRTATSGEVFVFLNRRRTHMKLLHWDHGGFVLYYVRRRPNHKGRAKLPEHLPVEEIEIHPGGDRQGHPRNGLLPMILTDKYMDHQPLYRQQQHFARDNIRITSSTIKNAEWKYKK